MLQCCKEYCYISLTTGTHNCNLYCSLEYAVLKLHLTSRTDKILFISFSYFSRCCSIMVVASWTDMSSSGVMRQSSVVEIPSLSITISCKRQAHFTIISTLSGFICSSVFKHLHLATNIPNLHSMQR